MNGKIKPRVLIEVCGGCADYEASDDVEVLLIDYDNDPAASVPEDWQDLVKLVLPATQLRRHNAVVRVNLLVEIPKRRDGYFIGRLLPPNNTGLEINQQYQLQFAEGWQAAAGGESLLITIAEEADKHGRVKFTAGDPRGK